LNDQKFNSSDEIEEVITMTLDDLISDSVQSLFQNRMSRLASVIENRREYAHEEKGS
jgi:hypothetical protein